MSEEKKYVQLRPSGQTKVLDKWCTLGKALNND